MNCNQNFLCGGLIIGSGLGVASLSPLSLFYPPIAKAAAGVGAFQTCAPLLGGIALVSCGSVVCSRTEEEEENEPNEVQGLLTKKAKPMLMDEEPSSPRL